MDKTPDNLDKMLEQHFSAARAEAPGPSAELLGRVLADADALRAERARPARMPARRRALWAGMLASIGGWPALGGLAAAGLAGVWIGVAQPQGLETGLSLLPGSLTGGDGTGSVFFGAEDALGYLDLDFSEEG